jgi:hypothetical protein
MKLIIATSAFVLIWLLGCVMLYWIDRKQHRQEMIRRKKYPQASGLPSKPKFLKYKK